MTYNEYIQNIINTRGQWSMPECGVWENHHIIPRCKKGKPIRWSHDMIHDNLIWLAPHEHYEAHKLLYLENPGDKKLCCAYFRIALDERGKHITAEEYEEARIALVNILTGSIQSDETNLKRSTTMKNYKLHWYTNGVIELRIPEGIEVPDHYIPGRKAIAESTRIKMKNRPKLLGELNGMFGKHQSKESNEARSNWSSIRQWFNDGVNEYFEIEGPQGCTKGRLNSNRKWYNNGLEEKYAFNCPEGFVQGRLRK